MMTAAKRFGLYSAFRACKAIFFKSSLHPRLTVDTIFWKETDYQKKVVNVLFNGKLGRMKNSKTNLKLRDDSLVHGVRGCHG